MSTLLEITDHRQLSALHAAIMNAKFDPYGPDHSLINSPHLASLAQKVVDALASHDPEAEARDGWERWRLASLERREVAIVIERLKNSPIYYRCSDSQRDKLIHTALSPLTLPANEHAQLRSILDSYWNEVVHGEPPDF